MHALSADSHGERTTQFQAIYRREFAFVWACARRFGVAPAVVDDAVQDVFLTAYRRLDHLRYEVSPRAWLYGVTRKVASHYRRGAMRLARKVEALRRVPPPAEAPHQRLDAAQQLDALLAGLTPGNREVFELVEVLGMSGPEVAAEIGQPLNTVYSRLRLARAQLQATVAATDLDAVVIARRERDAPPREQAQRSWMIVAPLLGRPTAGLGLASLLTARAAITTTMIAVSVGLTIAATRGAPATRPSPPTHASPTITPTVATPTPAPAPVPAPATADSLTREVALLDRARARLAADTPDALAEALALLAAHAGEFPRGALADAREATRVEVLCRQGQAAAAATAAADLRSAYPTSTIARRLENYNCQR